MKTKIGFMCETSFHHHMGKGKKGEHPDPKGVIVYPTVRDLRAGRKCVRGDSDESCGIIRVKVVLDKVIKKS